jgi:class 3 adenylate cyclase
MMLFGVPVAQEDHARRAILAALGVLHRLSASRDRLHLLNGEPLSVRTGLHMGLVAVGGIDEAWDIAATVIGDIELVARALQEMAEPDSILCSDTTARQVQGTLSLDTVRAGTGPRAVVSHHGPQSPRGRSPTLAASAARGARLESVCRS